MSLVNPYIRRREDCFRFLNLPAELRNRVYELCAFTPEANELCVLPCISLARASKQLRVEYYPICMKSAVTIGWKDFQSYLDTFYPTVDGKIENIKLAPSKITMMTKPGTRHGDGTVVDLLPLVKFGLYDRHFSCHFNHVENFSQSSSFLRYEQEQAPYTTAEDIKGQLKDYIRQDGEKLEGLIKHRHPKWASDVAQGHVVKILISDIGLCSEPKALFHISPYAEPRFSKVRDGECTEYRSEWCLDYFESVDLLTTLGTEFYSFPQAIPI